MNDFRGPLPLRDRDFAEVRAKVLSTIAGRPLGGFVFRSALAATAAAVLLLLVLPRPVPTMKPPSHRTARSAAVPHPAPAPIAVTPIAVTPIVPAPPQNAATEEPHEQVAAGGDCACGITMNIETADPNVRIIWISR